MANSPVLVLKSSRATIGRSPIHGNKPISMVRVQSRGRDKPFEVGVPPYMQPLNFKEYEDDAVPLAENRFDLGNVIPTSEEKLDRFNIPDKKTLKRRLAMGDQSIHPSKRLGIRPRYRTTGPPGPTRGKSYLVEPAFGSFWSGPTLMDLRESEPAGHRGYMNLLGTTATPRELDAQVRGPYAQHEQASEAFVRRHVKPEELLDLTPIVTAERGYNPYWYNNPDEKDPEHAYAEERKFKDSNPLTVEDFDQLVYQTLKQPRGMKHGMHTSRDLAGQTRLFNDLYRDSPEGYSRAIDNAMEFLREKLHPYEGHAMMQDLLMQSDIPNKGRILRRLSTDVPSPDYIRQRGGRYQEVTRNPKVQAAMHENIMNLDDMNTSTYPPRRNRIKDRYMDLRATYEKAGEDPDAPENRSHIMGHINRMPNDLVEEIMPKGMRLATAQDMINYEMNKPRKELEYLSNKLIEPYDWRSKIGFRPQTDWAGSDDPIFDQLKLDVADISALNPDVSRVLPYQWWDEKTKQDPRRLGIDYDEYLGLARRVGQGLEGREFDPGIAQIGQTMTEPESGLDQILSNRHPTPKALEEYQYGEQGRASSLGQRLNRQWGMYT